MFKFIAFHLIGFSLVHMYWRKIMLLPQGNSIFGYIFDVCEYIIYNRDNIERTIEMINYVYIKINDAIHFRTEWIWIRRKLHSCLEIKSPIQFVERF